jgi:hypothetical protein
MYYSCLCVMKVSSLIIEKGKGKQRDKYHSFVNTFMPHWFQAQQIEYAFSALCIYLLSVFF